MEPNKYITTLSTEQTLISLFILIDFKANGIEDVDE